MEVQFKSRRDEDKIPVIVNKYKLSGRRDLERPRKKQKCEVGAATLPNPRSVTACLQNRTASVPAVIYLSWPKPCFQNCKK